MNAHTKHRERTVYGIYSTGKSMRMSVRVSNCAPHHITLHTTLRPTAVTIPLVRCIYQACNRLGNSYKLLQCTHARTRIHARTHIHHTCAHAHTACTHSLAENRVGW